MAFLSGPFNLQQGNSVEFVVEFLDSNSNLSIPAVANMAVTYTNTSNLSQTDTTNMTLTGSFYTSTWSSTSAALGLATWVATAGSTVQIATGQLRVIQRQGD